MRPTRKRYGWERCRKSMFVSKLRDGVYTGAASLPFSLYSVQCAQSYFTADFKHDPTEFILSVSQYSWFSVTINFIYLQNHLMNHNLKSFKSVFTVSTLLALITTFRYITFMKCSHPIPKFYGSLCILTLNNDVDKINIINKTISMIIDLLMILLTMLGNSS